MPTQFDLAIFIIQHSVVITSHSVAYHPFRIQFGFAITSIHIPKVDDLFFNAKRRIKQFFASFFRFPFILYTHYYGVIHKKNACATETMAKSSIVKPIQRSDE